MNRWAPREYKHTMCYDPKDEIRLRMQHALQENEPYLAIPTDLAYALAFRMECRNIEMIVTDGEHLSMSRPRVCRLVDGHNGGHSDGHIFWTREG